MRITAQFLSIMPWSVLCKTSLCSHTVCQPYVTFVSVLSYSSSLFCQFFIMQLFDINIGTLLHLFTFRNYSEKCLFPTASFRVPQKDVKNCTQTIYSLHVHPHSFMCLLTLTVITYHHYCNKNYTNARYCIINTTVKSKGQYDPLQC